MTQVPFHPGFRFIFIAFILGLIAAGAGCGSTSHQGFEGPAERPVAMKGMDKFFNGDIDAILTVSRGFGHGHRGKGHDKDDEVPDLADVFSAELNDSENKNYEETYEKMRALQIHGSPLPPVVLQLILTSHGKVPVEVEVREINSDLGNFAVRPDKLTLTPEKAASPDPMTSLLGVTSDEIAVKISLKVAGKTENKTILVKSIFTPDGKKK